MAKQMTTNKDTTAGHMPQEVDDLASPQWFSLEQAQTVPMKGEKKVAWLPLSSSRSASSSSVVRSAL